MLTLVILVLFLGVVVTVLLAGWTLWFQTYIYTEPPTGLLWRGPAAGAAVLAAIVVWVFFDYQAPGRYRPLYEFSPRETVKPFPELLVPTASGKEDVYKLRAGTRNEYRLGGLSSGKALPTRPAEVIVVEDGAKASFKPERDEQGNFKQRSTKGLWGESKEPLRYLDEKGRVMYEDGLGTLASYKPGWLLGNLVLNFLLLGVLFGALWVALEFQWPHALGQAVVIWGVLLLFVMPPLLTRAEQVAREREAARGA